MWAYVLGMHETKWTHEGDMDRWRGEEEGVVYTRGWRTLAENQGASLEAMRRECGERRQLRAWPRRGPSTLDARLLQVSRAVDAPCQIPTGVAEVFARRLQPAAALRRTGSGGTEKTGGQGTRRRFRGRALIGAWRRCCRLEEEELLLNIYICLRSQK